jgi:hypothetical protein
MLDFTTPAFAMAGLLAAAGPVLVHLLNRRRFRVVAWGPMEFLREALQRQRRTLELRDLVLLTLRILVVMALGFGLARPFLRGSGGLGTAAVIALGALLILAAGGGAAAVVLRGLATRLAAGAVCGMSLLGVVSLWGWSATASNPSSPGATSTGGAVHAILLLDNSRSLGVASAAGTGLDRARSQAQRFIEQLPADSRITIIPLAGSEEPFPRDPFAGKDAARRALEQVRLIDAAASVTSGLEQAEQAGRQTPELPTKRIVLWSDLQANGWAEIDWAAWTNRLPDLQIAPVVEPLATNLAVERVTLEDGFAGTESPSRFLVRVAASETLSAPATVDVLLSLDDVPVGNQLLELAPGQSREVEFVHQFEIAGEPGRPHWVVATATLQPADPQADQLAADNRLSVTVPVVDAVPVVYGSGSEDVARNRIGETHALRHLLAPQSSGVDSERRTIRVQHLAVDQVTHTVLETARLVVVAGLEAPGELTTLLREYVEQGGPLVILAGGEFDPAKWQAEAWHDGRGILPAPLGSEPVGSLPESTAELHPFFANFQTMQNDLFLVEGEDAQTLGGLFDTLPFFRAVQVDVAGADSVATAAADSGKTEPKWWLWRSTSRQATRGEAAATENEPPRVLASFSRVDLPWVVERRIGLGRVVFFSSGVSSDWNLLRTSGAMYVFHRLMSRLMADTLPERNFSPTDRIVFPWPAGAAERLQLVRPSGAAEPAPLEALEADVTGVRILQPLTAGVYQLHATAADPTPASGSPSVTFCVQAPVSESDLTFLSPDELRSQLAGSDVRVLAVDELPRVEGGSRRGQSLWKTLLAGMLGLLLVEMAVLAWPVWRKGAA